jgi:hypothetical protein
LIRITTYTGGVLDLEAPTPDMIRIEDVVQGLSNTCRFSGQVDTFYSVLQHAMLVASLVDEPFVWPALHHDDTEAYMCDLSRHLKHHAGLAGYVRFEDQLAQVLAIKFKCSMNDYVKTHVKAADDLAAVFEHWVLRRNQAWDPQTAIDWAYGYGFVRCDPAMLFALAPRLPRKFRPLSPEEVRFVYWPLYRRLEQLCID